MNVCGKCGKKQMKFQQMENKLLEMEKQRMEMFMDFEDEDGEEYDEEYKEQEQFRKMTDEEIERHIGLEKVRNVMEGFDREHGIDKIRRMIQEVRNEDKKEEPEDEKYESDSSETQRMKRLQWIQDNRKPKNWKRPQKLLKEKMTIYSKRMLFTYKNCGCCKKKMTDLKDLLNNIFPAGICDEICDYNLHCSKCKNLNDKERRYIDFNCHFDYFNDKKLTRVEKNNVFL